MQEQKAGLFGIKYSNRDFTQTDTWGKNQFNSSFPTSLTSYLYSKGLENIYMCVDKNLKVNHRGISTEKLFGINPSSDNLFFSFESVYSPYQQLVIGNLPRIDLVTIERGTGQCLRPIEIKLTALPDNTTCNLSDNEYGCEIVIRPDTIVYLACSILIHFKNDKDVLSKFMGNQFNSISDWAEGHAVWLHIPAMIATINNIMKAIWEKQEPLLIQPIWKTKGKTPTLSDNCLDVFVWSNLAFTQLFIDATKNEFNEGANKITRQLRTIIWLFKMIFDFANQGQINPHKIIDELSYNTKNDKAFALNGKITHKYMTCEELTEPRIKKAEIKNIILGGGQNLLSPERRFDAIIYNSPELFL